MRGNAAATPQDPNTADQSPHAVASSPAVGAFRNSTFSHDGPPKKPVPRHCCSCWTAKGPEDHVVSEITSH